MRQVILDQPQQITHTLKVNKDVKVRGNFDSIILCGVGGSGHPGDLLNALSLPRVPLYVHRDYGLPLNYLSHMGLKQPLVIASSYSGNTEETLTGYQTARDANLPLLVSTSGGTLRAWAKRDRAPLTLIDFPGLQPRHTLLASFAGITAALANSGLADDGMENNLKQTARALARKIPDLEKPAKEMAAGLKGQIPVFSSSGRLGFAAKNLKIQTNENAKAPAFWNTFPELNHNELVGFSRLLKEGKGPGRFHAVFLHSEDDHRRNTARMEITAGLYRKWGLKVSRFDTSGETQLEKILTAVMFGLWTTYYLALEYNLDPVPVEGVEDFKKLLKNTAGKSDVR